MVDHWRPRGQMLQRLLLGGVLLAVLSACTGTRVALPLAADSVIGGLAESGVIGPADRSTQEWADGGRQRIIIDHRNPDAVWKKPVATTILVVTSLSPHSSEVLVRSDHIGWLINWRDHAREQDIASALRSFSFAQAEAPPEAQPAPAAPSEPAAGARDAE